MGSRVPGALLGTSAYCRMWPAIRACVEPGSGSGRGGAIDGEEPVAAREIQRPNNQEEGRPSVDAVREAHDPRGGRDTATGDTPDPKEAEVAVLKWEDEALHPGSRRRCHHPRRPFATVLSLDAFIADSLGVLSTTRSYQYDITLM